MSAFSGPAKVRRKSTWLPPKQARINSFVCKVDNDLDALKSYDRDTQSYSQYGTRILSYAEYGIDADELNTFVESLRSDDGLKVSVVRLPDFLYRHLPIAFITITR